jgi:hypothetical protein
VILRLVPDPEQEYDHTGRPVDGPTRYVRRPIYTGRPRVGFPARLSIPKLRVLHRRHMAGVSLNSLGREVWQESGYASQEAASVSIGAQFRRLGWPTRSQREASSLRQRTAPTGVRA